MASAIRLGLAGGTALAGPLGGHFAVPLTAAACVLLLCVRTAPTPAAVSAVAAAPVRDEPRPLVLPSRGTSATVAVPG
ncbi:hypothetical protein [Streptomyces sp. IBSBF 3352]|uniref:hypothetical protein n=1 Tax=Streptomyces sp. IBSBF 3352 TaxID=2903523 RepID=UPI002FDC7A4C